MCILSGHISKVYVKVSFFYYFHIYPGAGVPAWVYGCVTEYGRVSAFFLELILATFFPHSSPCSTQCLVPCATNCSLKLTAKGYEHLPVSKRKVKRKLIKYKGKCQSLRVCVLGNTVNIYGAIAQCEWANGTADKETGGPTRTTRWFTSQMVNARLSESARESDTESVHMQRRSGGKWVVSLPRGGVLKSAI